MQPPISLLVKVIPKISDEILHPRQKFHKISILNNKIELEYFSLISQTVS